tara:strand:+ start:183 stop:473 length:291 start_codon:yes stop_codon:yes gene_type:complete
MLSNFLNTFKKQQNESIPTSRRHVIKFDETLLPLIPEIINIIKQYMAPKCSGTHFRGRKVICDKPGIIYPTLYGVNYMPNPMCLGCELLTQWEYDI